jgi:hypothetical protein
MKKVSSPTSTFRLRAAGRVGAGRPQRETVNDKLLNQAWEAVFVNHALACTSRVPDKLKYYFLLRGTLPT